MMIDRCTNKHSYALFLFNSGSLEKNVPVAQFLQNDIMLLVLWPSSLTRRIKLVFQGAMQCKAVPGEQPSKLTMSEMQNALVYISCTVESVLRNIILKELHENKSIFNQ